MSYFEYHVAKRYVQFAGALYELPRYAALIGKKILVLTACGPATEKVVNRIWDGLRRSTEELLQPALVESSVRYAGYQGMCERIDALREEMHWEFLDLMDQEVSRKNVQKMAEFAAQGGFDTVVGIGGGKGMDFARAMTHYLPLKVILVPTLAATNASISTLSVIYSDDGRILEYWRMDNAPELVLADTEILIGNGPKVLSAGIGDIMATYQEALVNFELSGQPSDQPLLGIRGVRLAAELLKENAPSALRAAETGVVDAAFENVLSMILHNPGPLWTVCTTGYAHVLDEIFLFFESAHRVPHGLRVGLAVVPMLLLLPDGAQQAEAYLAFMRAAGIPADFAALGLGFTEKEKWAEAFDATVGKTGRLASLPFEIGKEKVIENILSAEAFLRQY